ncbi:discoidin domain-containing protein [Solitalea sp. MAHUQ-68]|uniref:Discoidin domain-containing protein n=1 Tax=Solitalea agri TaxID=2953739 RepID=A0A9X2JES6_9SPHI|nr:discoidin domain-containing protein [Solitalea agri]MCO4292706.1 discoidin domain-containing protein [Solitalea agri]
MKKLYITLVAITTIMMVSCEDSSVLFDASKFQAGSPDNMNEWTITTDSEVPSGEEWLDDSGEHFTGFAKDLLDGNVNTYWHTDYTKQDYEYIDPYPHWVLIDMKKENHLVSISVTNRQGNRKGMKKFKLEGSMNGTEFTSLGEFEFQGIDAPQSYPLSSTNGYRYIKLTAIEGYTAAQFTYLSEISFTVLK